MSDEVKEEIKVVLQLLKSALIKNGVSMYLDGENKKIGFFDTEQYLKTKKLDGFSVGIDELVR